LLACWAKHRGEYRATSLDGSAATPELIEDTARAIQARLANAGPELYDVSVEGRSISVLLGPTQDVEVTRKIITSRGEVVFVAVPADTSLAAGDPVPGVEPLFGAEAVASAQLVEDMAGRTAIEITLTPAAAARFRTHTADHFGEQFAIALDGTVLAAPTINAVIDGPMQISGGFDDATAASLLAFLLSRPQVPGGIEELSFDEFTAPGC
jgi:preprotein translocase subunit SecD